MSHVSAPDLREMVGLPFRCGDAIDTMGSTVSNPLKHRLSKVAPTAQAKSGTSKSMDLNVTSNQ